MAIYHLEAKVISRGIGRTACGAAAYMSCSKIYNDYDGIQHDYTRKRGLVWEHIFLPPMAPAAWQDRETLWNAVEANEKVKDSQLAREFIVALPVELGQVEWQTLLTGFIQEQFVADGMCADVAIHDTDGHNPHAHILLTMRPLDEKGKWQYKTEKEYLCVKGGEERGFTAAEFKTAQADGWEKQYPYKVGKKKVYMTPSAAETQGYVRADKHPKSTRYGRQNPITARWNSGEQLILWREAWAGAVNRALEKEGLEERIDHRSHAERGLDEQPTIHEGVIARSMEAKGFISDRYELNRQIKADNALLRELKAAVRKLAQAVKNTVPVIAEAMESLRGNMLLFRYQLRRIGLGKQKQSEYVNAVKPELERYSELVRQIKSMAKERRTLLAEKKETPVLSVLRHRDLSRRIAELTEDLGELKSEKELVLHTLNCADDAAVSTVKKDVTAMEDSLKKLAAQEERYKSELDAALREYTGLVLQATELDADELTAARLDLRPEKERSAISRVQKAYGEKYDPQMMAASKRDVAKMLGEETERKSVREMLKVQHRGQERRQQRVQRKDDLER